MKSVSAFLVISLLAATLCNAQTQTYGNTFRQEGIASWYGVEFEGRPTASGESFDPNQFTAAHPDLPFGTLLIITNAVNGEKVMVRVNDRGPFVKSRIIDVSKAAAEKLNMLEAGTAQVIIELAPRSASTGALTTGEPPTTGGFYDNVPGQQLDTSQQPYPVNTAMPLYTPQQPSVVQAPSGGQPAFVPQTTAPAVPPPAGQSALVPQTTAPAVPPPAGQPALVPQTTAPAVPPPAGQPAFVPQTTAPAVPQVTRQPAPTVPAPTGRQPGSPPSAIFQPIPTTARPPVPPASGSPSLPAAGSAPSASGTPQRSYQRYASAEILGGPVVSGRSYRLQIGSFRVAKNAVDVFDRLKTAGLNPQWEPFENMYRIVISNIRAEDVGSVAASLGGAGFKEALISEER